MELSRYLLTSESAIEKATKWLTSIASVCLGIMMFLSVFDIIGAKVFKTSIPGTILIVEELMVIMLFLAIAYVQYERGHIAITLVYNRMNAKAVYIVDVVKNATGMVLFGFITWRSFVLLQNAIRMMAIKPGEIDIPLWPSILTVFVGSALLTVTYIFFFLKKIFLKAQS